VVRKSQFLEQRGRRNFIQSTSWLIADDTMCTVHDLICNAKQVRSFSLSVQLYLVRAHVETDTYTL